MGRLDIRKAPENG